MEAEVSRLVNAPAMAHLCSSNRSCFLRFEDHNTWSDDREVWITSAKLHPPYINPHNLAVCIMLDLGFLVVTGLTPLPSLSLNKFVTFSDSPVLMIWLVVTTKFFVESSSSPGKSFNPSQSLTRGLAAVCFTASCR